MLDAAQISQDTVLSVEGLTVHYLLHWTYQVQRGDTVLIHAAAGGVGLIFCQWARHLGATVIGTVGTAAKAALAEAHGCDHPIINTERNFREAVMNITDGKGVHKALDCSGNVAAHRLCIDATRRRGQVAFVGECSDETSIRISSDMIRKGLTLVGSWHYNRRDAEAILRIIEERPTVMDQLISHTFPMTDVQQAFELQSTGDCAKVLLHPWETS